MSRNNNDRKRIIATPLIALLMAVVTSIAFASVFVYYPISVQVSAVGTPVKIGYGSNSNKPDLGSDNTIQVNVGEGNASLSIKIHPTYQVSYYKNISIITNTDTKAYNICIRVVTPIAVPSGGFARLYIYNKGATRSMSGFPTPFPTNYVSYIDLTTTEITCIGSLSGSVYEIDLYVYTPEGESLPSGTAELYLIYTPSGETPP
jgi:flagellar basal body-associated protein FliL